VEFLLPSHVLARAQLASQQNLLALKYFALLPRRESSLLLSHPSQIPHQKNPTVITSQCPIKDWHHIIGEPTIADAILDRLLHHGYKIELKGESIRKSKK